MNKAILFLLLSFFCYAQNTKYEYFKIIIFVDKTYSIKSNYFPKLTKKHLQILREKIQHYGGEFAIGVIGESSKEHLYIERYNANNEKPMRRDFSSATVYFEALKKHYRTRKKSIIDYKQLNNLLDYSILSRSSDITSAINIAYDYLNEVINKKNVYKLALFITDGQENMNLEEIPEKFPFHLITINRNSSEGIFRKYSNKRKYTNIETCLNELAN